MIFDHPTTLEDLKRQYHKLAFAHHPDRGGDTATMQAINNEYDRLFALLKNTFRNKEGEIYTRCQDNSEAPEAFRDLIDRLVRMPGLVIEIIGSFVWVTGNTRKHKEALKEMRFRWHQEKLAWYLAPEWYRKRNRREYSMDEMRRMWGSGGVYEGREEEARLMVAG